MRREYTHGTKWCVWQWKDIVLYGELYLRRLHVFQCPWFSILVHWFYQPDPQPDLHDHPISFLSVVLRGGYVELRGVNGEIRERHVKYANWIRSCDKHRIISVEPYTMTLCFCGPREREWGFWTDQGFVPWTRYDLGKNPFHELEGAYEVDWSRMPKPGYESEYFERRE